MLASDQAGAQCSQSPVTADDKTSMLSWVQSRWSLLLTFQNNMQRNDDVHPLSVHRRVEWQWVEGIK
jgi:hypothetical protein